MQLASVPSGKSESHGTGSIPKPRMLWDLLQEGVTTNPHGIAIAALHQGPQHVVNGQKSRDHRAWTYQQLSSIAALFAANIEVSAGLSSDGSLTTFLPNGVDWALAYWTAAKLAVPIAALDIKLLDAPDASVQEHYLRTVNPYVVLVSDMDAAIKFDKIAMQTGLNPTLKLYVNRSATIQDSSLGWVYLEELLNSNSNEAESGVNRTHHQLNSDKTPDSPARILFTGGSTGLPKGCPHTSANLTAESEGFFTMRNLTSTSRTLLQSPNHHIMCNAAALLTWRAGGTAIFAGERFDPGHSIRAIKDYGVTYLPVHHSMTDAILRHPTFRTEDVRTVSGIQIGGALIGPDLAERYQTAFVDVEIFPFWGSTEGMYTTACKKGDDLSSENGLLSVGSAFGAGRVKVADPETCEVLPLNSVGELHYGGPTVISSYVGNSSPKDFYTDKQGHRWFKTGDQGRMSPDGHIYMLGRFKDMIKRGGENIFPQQIEHKLLSVAHTKAIIIGIPDPITSEACVAVVDPQASANFSKHQLQVDIVRLFGAEFVFAYILTLQDLGLQAYPLNPGGKVLKMQLRQTVLDYLKNQTQTTSDGRNNNAIDSSVQLITSIWGRLLHVEPSELDVEAKMSTFMDSLTSMRYCYELERATSKTLTIADLRDAPTIKDQAALISTGMPAHQGTATPMVLRKKAPSVHDILWCAGDEKRFDSLRKAVQPSLDYHGLTWEDDVEDVAAASNSWNVLLQAPEPRQACNMRFPFEVRGKTYEQIREAVQQAVRPRALLRAIATRVGRQGFYVQMRDHDKFMNNMVERGPSFSTIREAIKGICHNGDILLTYPPERLFRVHVSYITSTDTHLMTLSVAHSVVDAISNEALWNDIDTALSGQQLKRQEVPYQLFADMVTNNQESVAAHAAVRRIVRKATGMASDSDGFWPHLQHEKERSPETVYHNQILGPFRARIPGINEVQEAVNVSPAIVIKLAYALAVMRVQGTQSAHFASFMSGRQWPFEPLWVQQKLPNPLSISGPTSEMALNWLKPGHNETVRAILARLTVDEREQTEDIHAPMDAFVAALPAQDRKHFLKHVSQTVFNIVPDIRRLVGDTDGLWTNMHALPVTILGKMNQLMQCGLVEDELIIAPIIDESRLSRREVTKFCEQLFAALRDLVTPTTWDRPVLELSRKPVSGTPKL